MSLVIVGVFVGVPLMGIGAYVIGRYVFGRSRRSSRWPQVKGKILKSELIVWPPSYGDVAYVAYDGAYSLDFAYEYEVGGVRYESKRVSFETGNRTGSSKVEEVLMLEARYPPKAEILVYYDPDKPAFSVLEPLEPGVALRDLYDGVIALIVGAIIVAIGFAVGE